jgi:hypothetical protein
VTVPNERRQELRSLYSDPLFRALDCLPLRLMGQSRNLVTMIKWGEGLCAGPLFDFQVTPESGD